MLTKSYSSIGAFPDYGNTGTQLNVERATGKPTTTLPNRRNTDKIMRVRHGLQGEVRFYGVTHLGNDMLIAISDEGRTRYYWECAGKRYIHMAEGAVRGYEESWRLLFESLVLDTGNKSMQLYRSMARFFTEALDFDNYGEYTSRIKGEFKGEPCTLTLEVNTETPRMRINVKFSKFGQQSLEFETGISTPIHTTIGQLLSTS